MSETIWFKDENERKSRVEIIISQIYDALKEKGYDPVSQIVGYILSGDPTYITSHNGARSLITKVETDEILEEVVKHYLTKF